MLDNGFQKLSFLTIKLWSGVKLSLHQVKASLYCMTNYSDSHFQKLASLTKSIVIILVPHAHLAAFHAGRTWSQIVSSWSFYKRVQGKYALRRVIWKESDLRFSRIAHSAAWRYWWNFLSNRTVGKIFDRKVTTWTLLKSPYKIGMIILNSWVSGKSIKDTNDIFKSNSLVLMG